MTVRLPYRPELTHFGAFFSFARAQGVPDRQLRCKAALALGIRLPEIAAAAVYLASPEAKFMTGQTLVPDGGLTAY